MKEKLLINCNEYPVDGILKSAMVNAVFGIEKSASRREKENLRKFILECAKLLVTFPPQEVNREISQENMHKLH